MKRLLGIVLAGLLVGCSTITPKPTPPVPAPTSFNICTALSANYSAEEMMIMMAGTMTSMYQTKVMKPSDYNQAGTIYQTWVVDSAKSENDLLAIYNTSTTQIISAYATDERAVVADENAFSNVYGKYSYTKPTMSVIVPSGSCSTAPSDIKSVFVIPAWNNYRK